MKEFKVILIVNIIILSLVLAILILNIPQQSGRYYHDMDYSKDVYIDYWNDMWAECEFGEKNYNAIRKEYGID